jgi:hypothetical protein
MIVEFGADIAPATQLLIAQIFALAWAHAADALASGAAYLAKHGDDAKVARHACHVQAQGAQFLPASFSVLGAWGPAITARFDALWATEIQRAADNGESTWPVIRRKLNWRSKVSITLMRANAQMLLCNETISMQ